MSVETVSKLLAAARQPDSQFSKEKISATELQRAWTAAKTPEAGDPPGKPLTSAEAKLFEDLKVATDLTPSAKRLLDKILGEIPSLLAGSSPTGVIALPEKRGNKIYLKADAGFVVASTYGAPADALALTRTLYHAGEWLQASFGTDDNLFTKAALDVAGKRAVLKQFTDGLAKNLDSLTEPQRQQLLGSIAALTVELLKSIDKAALAPTAGTELKKLQEDAFALLMKTLNDDRLTVLVRRSVVGYLTQSDSFQPRITAAQKADIKQLNDTLFPTSPADYARWEKDKKSTIKIDHVCGQGENFTFGFVKQLLEEGVGNSRGAGGANKFTLVSGDPENGPAKLKVVIPASDSTNKWGRDITVEIDVHEYRRDIYAKMSDASVDIVSYGGHSNFGNNTLDALNNAPAQKGDKVICRDLCCGADTKNAEAAVYPDAALNGVTSVCSSYFHTADDPKKGKYANESEGYLMLMSVVRGMLAKKDWNTIGDDLAKNANWWGHDSTNNWTWPTDSRAGSFLDDDFDGIPNVFDIIPSYNTTDIPGSVAKEFDLKVPETPADEILGKRAFQSLQFLNTATNYNTSLETVNSQRKIIADPTGTWFDGKDEPKTYVRFREGRGGKVYVQLSSALASMTLESLRPILYVEAMRYYAKKDSSLFASKAEQNAMALLFASSALVNDQSYRDQEIFDGLKKIYGFSDKLAWNDFSSAVSDAEGRHNYTGDDEAIKGLVTKYKKELEAAGAGEPAITVS
jgi:hypothetical protein